MNQMKYIFILFCGDGKVTGNDYGMIRSCVIIEECSIARALSPYEESVKIREHKYFYWKKLSNSLKIIL